MSSVMTLKSYGTNRWGKIGARRMVSTLPYDAEVEYLESTGTQLIDTGYVPNQNTAVQFDLQLTSLAKDWTVCTGRRAIIGTNTFFYVQIHIPDTWYIVIGYSNNIVSVPITNPYSRHLIEVSIQDYRVAVDGNAFYAKDTYGGVNNYTLNIFGNIKVGGTMTDGQPMKLYKYDITDNGTLVHDLTPVRIGAIGALYDRRGIGGMNSDGSARNDGLYFNRGTGDFIIGPDKIA